MDVARTKPRKVTRNRPRARESMRVFLSHSSLDRPIADALSTLLREMFGPAIDVKYSSDQKAGGGIPPGAQWLPWIEARIRGAKKTYVLLTPNSTSKPWVLWEAGAAAGVALASHRDAVVPVTFGIPDDEIPSPFRIAQRVRGDTTEEGGIHRLLQDINQTLESPLSDAAFQSTTQDRLPPFFASIRPTLQNARGPLLAMVPSAFPASQLQGLWVTCYGVLSEGQMRFHADISRITPKSGRQLTASNVGPAPRRQSRKTAFHNEIDAEVANRHLIGHWKNSSDSRYFGAIHLSVKTGENIMEGYYTALSDDVTVRSGSWKWVRIDPRTSDGVDLPRTILREPGEISALLAAHSTDAGPLSLASVLEAGR